MRSLAFYMRLKVIQDREKRTMKLSQLGYIKKLLNCHDILKTKTAKVSIQETIFFPSYISAFKQEKAKYSAKIGLIMYAIIETRMNIAFATYIVSRFIKNPSLENFDIIDQILRYLAKSFDRDKIYGRDKKLKLIRYSYSDQARDYAD